VRRAAAITVGLQRTAQACGAVSRHKLDLSAGSIRPHMPQGRSFPAEPMGCEAVSPLPALVSPTGVEPVTFGFGGRRSIQLSYGDLRTLDELYRQLVKSTKQLIVLGMGTDPKPDVSVGRFGRENAVMETDSGRPQLLMDLLKL